MAESFSRKSTSTDKKLKEPPPASARQSLSSTIAVHIHALLHTMRVIQQHEDEFCTLMHTLEKQKALLPAQLRELHHLLGLMPGESFQTDLDVLRKLLPAPVAGKTEHRSKGPKPKAPGTASHAD